MADFPPTTQTHAFVSQLSSSVVVSVPSPPSPEPSPRQSGSFEYSPQPLGTLQELATLDPGLDLVLHFKRLPRGRARNSLLRDLLDHCERDELLLISTLVGPRLKRDFLAELPPELALHVLGFVDDAQTLTRIACVSKVWKGLLNEESLWRSMAQRSNFNMIRPEIFWPWSTFRNQFKTAFTTERNWRRGGRQIKVTRTPDEGVVTSLAMDDEWIVLGLNHNYVNVYDAKTGAKRHTLLGHQQGVWAIALISKGGWRLDPSEYEYAHVAAMRTPQSVRDEALVVCDPDTDEDPFTVPALGLGLGFSEGPAPGLSHVEEDQDAFVPVTPSGADSMRSDPCGATRGWGQPDALVVSGSSDRTVRVWNAATGKCLFVMGGHTATIRCMKALQGRTIVVSGSRDSTLKIWDVEQGVLLRTMAGHTDSVRCLDVFANRVVSGSYDCTLRLWDVDTGECLRVFTGHTQSVYTVAYDGLRIASGGLDQITRVWNPEDGRCIALLQGHNSLICRLQLSGRTLWTGGADGRVLVFDVTRNYVLAHRLAPHSMTSLASLQFTKRGAATNCLINDLLVSAASDGRVVLTDLRTGSKLRELTEKCEQVWCVGFKADRLVIVCQRHAKTVVELWAFRPEEADLY